MADPVIDLLAENPFGLGANFNVQSATPDSPITQATGKDESGNIVCRKNIEDITNWSCKADYCGSDFVTDLGTFLTKFGDVQSGKIVTGLTVTFNKAAQCSIDVAGHLHDTFSHDAGLSVGYADVSDFLPHEAAVVSPATPAEAFCAWDGFGVPNFGITHGDNCTTSGGSVSFSMEHKDETDGSGKHFIGKNLTPKCELSLDFVGIPTSNTAALLNADFAANANLMLGALADSLPSVDGAHGVTSNDAFTSYSLKATAYPLLATA